MFLWYWGLNSEPHSCRASVLLLEPYTPILLLLVCFPNSLLILPRIYSDLCIWDYRYVPQCLPCFWYRITNFLLELAWNHNLPISSSQVVEITEMHHYAWPCFFVLPGIRPRAFGMLNTYSTAALYSQPQILYSFS
jgi:hypothetical protein